MFDKRNAKMGKYNGYLVNTVYLKNGNSLVIIHLIGQHFRDEDRYPEQFKKYNVQDYKGD